MTEKEWLNNNDLSLKIWNNKYRNNNETFEEWLDRISDKNERIKQLIIDKKFLFGGRVLANRNVTDRKVTYSNCYVVTPPDDNIESIFECASKLARTFSYGGGVGIDLSKLRPRGAKTNNAAKESSGAVSFMDIYSSITGTISQNGRRGALMISLDINHPDIEEFIDCKTDLSRVNFANISVRVSDTFMKAVENDSNYILSWPVDSYTTGGDTSNWEYNKLYLEKGVYYKKIKARALFDKLVKNNWNYAEPGILYWDRITNFNLLGNNPKFNYAGVNPCAEEPLPAGGSCCLCSINLAEYVKNGRFDFATFEHDVPIVVEGINEVLMAGLPLHPLKEQQESVGNWRQVGIGTMGLADALIKMKLKYGSKESLEMIDEIFKSLATTAVETSVHLAKIQGCYPNCNKELLAVSPFIKALNLPSSIIEDIRHYGMFNSQLLTCAPCGSIATMLGVSTGVEPIFAMKYTRKTISLENKDTYFEVYTKIAQDWLDQNSGKQLPSYFVESKDIKPVDRVAVQGTLQKWIDASISSTTNLSNEATEQDVYDVYMEAWKKGLKGITIYRSGCAREGILTTETPKAEETQHEITHQLNTIEPKTRDDFGEVLTGQTFKHHTACGTLYVTVNKDEDGNIVEIFTNSSKNGTCKANLNGETRMASLALRAGVKVEEVIDQLKGIHCQSCAFARAKGNQIDGTSCPDIISKVIKKCYTKEVTPVKLVAKPVVKEEKPVKTSGEKCPECGHALDHTGGCKTCPECGYSKCE